MFTECLVVIDCEASNHAMWNITLSLCSLLFTAQFPFLIPILKKVISFTSTADTFTVITEAALAIVDARRKMAVPPKVVSLLLSPCSTLNNASILPQEKDLLQLLLEASADENDEPVCPGAATGSEGRSTKKTLTDMEIVGLSVGFLLAGDAQCMSVQPCMCSLKTLSHRQSFKVILYFFKFDEMNE